MSNFLELMKQTLGAAHFSTEGRHYGWYVTADEGEPVVARLHTGEEFPVRQSERVSSTTGLKPYEWYGPDNEEYGFELLNAEGEIVGEGVGEDAGWYWVFEFGEE